MNVTSLNSATIDRNRNRSAALFTLAAAAFCGLGLASTLVPAVEYAVTVVLLVLGGAAIAAWVFRQIARILRWRREDREDAAIAAAWRAGHARSARADAGVS